VEKENSPKKESSHKRVTRSDWRLRNTPLGTTGHSTINGVESRRRVRTRRGLQEGGQLLPTKTRNHMNTPCGVTVEPMRLAKPQKGLERPLVVDTGNMNMLHVEARDTPFSMGGDDEIIENETPPATPINVNDPMSDTGPSPSKRTRLSTNSTDMTYRPSRRRADEPILLSLGDTGMIDRYNGFDYSALVNDDGSGDGDDERSKEKEDELPDLDPIPDQGNSYIEKFSLIMNS
jgi:hypothetical protein